MSINISAFCNVYPENPVAEKNPLQKTHNKLFVTSIRYLFRVGKCLSRNKNCSQLRNNVVNRENLSFSILPSDFGSSSRGCKKQQPRKHMFSTDSTERVLPMGKQFCNRKRMWKCSSNLKRQFFFSTWIALRFQLIFFVRFSPQTDFFPIVSVRSLSEKTKTFEKVEFVSRVGKFKP